MSVVIRKAFTVYGILLIAGLVVSSPAFAIGTEEESEEAARIVEGSDVPECGWPTTLYTGGCTAALVHPKVITSAPSSSMAATASLTARSTASEGSPLKALSRS